MLRSVSSTCYLFATAARFDRICGEVPQFRRAYVKFRGRICTNTQLAGPTSLLSVLIAMNQPFVLS